MAINLHEKYAKKVADLFQEKSLIDGRLNNEYSFVGSRGVKITTIQTTPLNDYTRQGANRYGTPEEVQDMVQELLMGQDKSFTMTVDKGNNSDQDMLKSAGKVLALEMKEQVVPYKDQYTFAKLCREAGQIVGNATALTKSTVLPQIDKAIEALDDAEVPKTDRTLFVPNSVFTLMKQAGMDLHSDKITQKAFHRGEVGEYDNMPIVKVPKNRWPKNVNFLVLYKNSATAPSKIADTKLHKDPPGISGNLMEGRFYFDVFVLGAKADGIYVEVDTGTGKGTVLAAPTVNAATGAITGASGASFQYTTDGSDPRYSTSAKAGTATTTVAGTVVRAYAYKDGAYSSPVTAVTITGA